MPITSPPLQSEITSRTFANRVKRMALLLGSVYLIAVGYLWAVQDHEVFPGAFKARPEPVPPLPPTWKPFAVKTADGLKLDAHELPPASPSVSRWCLYFHGQWGRAFWDFPKWKVLHDAGFGIIIFNYRGYQGSQGQPSESGIYADADAMLNWMEQERRIPPDRILVYGHSFGSGPAIDLAARRQVGALIVDGAFTSIQDCGAARYPFLPVHLVCRSSFNSLSKISRDLCPLLILHAKYDQINPVEHARRLFNSANLPKTLVELEGRHEDFQWIDAERYAGAVQTFASAWIK